jgi:mRNA interferase RelE/StbE
LSGVDTPKFRQPLVPTFKLFETEDFRESFKSATSSDSIWKSVLKRIVYPILQTAPDSDLRAVEIRPLSADNEEIWRMRVGPYRFFYMIERTEKIVYMLASDSIR